jgi:adenylyltransferase/sulfurtransferase
MLSPDELSRYSRHLKLEAIGIDGQQRLAGSRVLVVGLGGLGSPAALYLAAAGVGTLGMADFDRVEGHNLQRQVLFDATDVGKEKVAAAAARLRALNPLIRVVEHPGGVTLENTAALFSAYDLIVDGTDTFSARYMISDAAGLCGKPVVHGSVLKFEGQVTVFDTARGGPCYRCLYPQPPPAGSIPACGDAGVLGALCGAIGSLQAMETVKLIAGAGEPLRGRVLVFDALSARFHTFSFARDPQCPACGDRGTGSVCSRIAGLPKAGRGGAPGPPQWRIVPDEPQLEHGSSGTTRPALVSKLTHSLDMQPGEFPLEIDVEEAKRLVDTNEEGALLIDVREPFELAICRIPGAEHIPLGEVTRRAGALPTDRHLLILCHHGNRSRAATEYLRAQGLSAVSNIAGGIDAWARRIDPGMRRY